MRSLIYLFIVHLTIGNLSSANWVPDWESCEDFMGCFFNLRYKPISININTNTVQMITPPTQLVLSTVESAVKSTILVNTGQSVQTVIDYKQTTDNITGGFLPGSFIRLGFIYYWSRNASSNDVGTTINGKGFPAEARVVLRNKKYNTIGEAVKHQDGLAELLFIHNICSTPNSGFNQFANKMKLLQKAGSFASVPLSTHIDSLNHISQDTWYYSYMGSYLDTYTGQRYKCSRVIFNKPNPSYCITREQFEKAFGNLEDFCGETYTDTLPHDYSYVPVSITKGIAQQDSTC